MVDFYWARVGLRWYVFRQDDECTEGEPLRNMGFWREGTAAKVTNAIFQAFNDGVAKQRSTPTIGDRHA